MFQQIFEISLKQGLPLIALIKKEKKATAFKGLDQNGGQVSFADLKSKKFAADCTD